MSSVIKKVEYWEGFFVPQFQEEMIEIWLFLEDSYKIHMVTAKQTMRRQEMGGQHLLSS